MDGKTKQLLSLIQINLKAIKLYMDSKHYYTKLNNKYLQK